MPRRRRRPIRLPRSASRKSGSGRFILPRAASRRCAACAADPTPGGAERQFAGPDRGAAKTVSVSLTNPIVLRVVGGECRASAGERRPHRAFVGRIQRRAAADDRDRTADEDRRVPVALDDPRALLEALASFSRIATKKRSITARIFSSSAASGSAPLGVEAQPAAASEHPKAMTIAARRLRTALIARLAGKASPTLRTSSRRRSCRRRRRSSARGP